jgi:hypothetical protein
MLRVRRQPWWFLPAFCVLLGLGCLAAFWIGDDPTSGVISFLILALTGLGFAAFGRFDVVRGLRGDGRDEYWQRIDLTATALAGLVAIFLIIGMCFWEWAHGRDGTPYSQLGAITGVSYVVFVAVLRWRS